MRTYSGPVSAAVPEDLRLDRYVAENLRLLSRSQIKAKKLRAMVNGKEVKLSRLVKGGDLLELSWTDPAPENLLPEDIPLNIIYEDSRLVVVNKAQGMVVHPGAGNHSGTLANALLARRLMLGACRTCEFLLHKGAKIPDKLAPLGVCKVEFCDKSQNSLLEGLKPDKLLGRAVTAEAREPCVPNLVREPCANRRLGIVHRLDKDTSGVIIAAYDEETLAFLSSQFKERQTRKIYAAIVKGSPPLARGKVDMRIVRDSRDRKRFTVSSDRGKAALTKYRIIRQMGGYSLLLLKPRTGRTHQIRVHLKYLGCPILGDPVYGQSDTRFPHATLMLHAKSLSIAIPGSASQPETALTRTFSAPLPPRFREILRALR